MSYPEQNVLQPCCYLTVQNAPSRDPGALMLHLPLDLIAAAPATAIVASTCLVLVSAQMHGLGCKTSLSSLHVPISSWFVTEPAKHLECTGFGDSMEGHNQHFQTGNCIGNNNAQILKLSPFAGCRGVVNFLLLLTVGNYDSCADAGIHNYDL